MLASLREILVAPDRKNKKECNEQIVPAEYDSNGSEDSFFEEDDDDDDDHDDLDESITYKVKSHKICSINQQKLSQSYCKCFYKLTLHIFLLLGGGGF